MSALGQAQGLGRLAGRQSPALQQGSEAPVSPGTFWKARLGSELPTFSGGPAPLRRCPPAQEDTPRFPAEITRRRSKQPVWSGGPGEGHGAHFLLEHPLPASLHLGGFTGPPKKPQKLDENGSRSSRRES